MSIKCMRERTVKGIWKDPSRERKELIEHGQQAGPSLERNKRKRTWEGGGKEIEKV